jgi:cytochrome oxidase assembly protein ShyY1
VAAPGDRAARDRAGRIRAVLGLFREPGWLRALAAVAALGAVFLLLGSWQWDRYRAAERRAAQVRASWDRPAVPLTVLLPQVGSPLPAAEQWRAVLVEGRYRAADTVLIRNRPVAGRFGYEVLIPLERTDGTVLWVDRGWIPNGRTAAGPDSVPAPPAGRVRVLLRLRPAEPGVDRTLPPGQRARIDLPRMSAELDRPAYQAYGVLGSETAVDGAAVPVTVPVPLPRPEPDLGPHLSYAVQWVGFAVTAWIMLGVYAVREAARRAGTGQVGAGRSGTGRVGAGWPGGSRRGPRHPSDEEVEDALTGTGGDGPQAGTPLDR